jgi:MbtH protein
MQEAMDGEGEVFEVVINAEEQYSIWRAGRAPPPGWSTAGKSGSEAECLAYIDETWTDMRPASLRRKLQDATPRTVATDPAEDDLASLPPLIERLSVADHAIEVVVQPSKDVLAFRRALADGYVHLLFTGTKGGTHLQVALDPGGVRWEQSGSEVHLSGSLHLDGVACRCTAKVDVSSLSGTGRVVAADGEGG